MKPEAQGGYPKSHSPQGAAPGFKSSRPGPSSAVHSTQPSWPFNQLFWNVCCTCSPIKPTGLAEEHKIQFQITLQRCNVYQWIFATLLVLQTLYPVPGTRSPLDGRNSAKTLLPDSDSDAPETLTRAGVRAGVLHTAVPNRFKDSLEEFFRGQSPSHLGSYLLKDVRKLCGAEKMNDEE